MVFSFQFFVLSFHFLALVFFSFWFSVLGFQFQVFSFRCLVLGFIFFKLTLACIILLHYQITNINVSSQHRGSTVTINYIYIHIFRFEFYEIEIETFSQFIFDHMHFKMLQMKGIYSKSLRAVQALNRHIPFCGCGGQQCL